MNCLPIKPQFLVFYFYQSENISTTVRRRKCDVGVALLESTLDGGGVSDYFF